MHEEALANQNVNILEIPQALPVISPTPSRMQMPFLTNELKSVYSIIVLYS